MIDIKDTITLDDNNQYLVVSKINYNNKIYYYLIDKNNAENLKFCYLNNDELVETNNKELITMLLPLFLDVAKDEIDNF